VHVQVIDLLSAVPVAVDDEPVAILGDALAAREVARDDEHMTDQCLIAVGDVVRRRYRLVGNDQDVGRRPRMDVAEGRDALVLVDDVRRQFAPDDALEEGRHGGALKTVAPRAASRR
jgi:hypothetical protein